MSFLQVFTIVGLSICLSALVIVGLSILYSGIPIIGKVLILPLMSVFGFFGLYTIIEAIRDPLK